MKHNYLNMQRLALNYAITVWLVVLSANLALSQQRADINPGVLRIKVSEELAQRLETSRMSRNADNVLLTGVQSIDRVNLRHKVSTIKRVFRDGGKFEAKHRKYGLHRWYEVQMDKTVSVTEALAAYQAIEHIEKVEPSYKKSLIGSRSPDFGPVVVAKEDIAKAPLIGSANDPMLGSQWHYNNTGQAGGTPGSDIRLFQAWGIETGTPNVIVAVTDGGAQVNHPDLAANMWVNTDEIPGNDLDDDNNGFVDDINGYGFGDDTGEIAPDDHGTHTSGTVAAVTNNGIGVAGVAGGTGAGDGARIMTLAAFGGVANGGFDESYVYGADNGAVISQNSWGYNGANVFEQAVLDAIDYFIDEAGKDENGNQVGPMRGGLVIFAAGNDDQNGNFYPGFYDKTLAVGGLTNQDKKAWYSNFGNWVDMSAPGGETFVANDTRGVLSTIAGNQYAFFQGTSMACPHVSGVAALIVSKFGGPGFTPEMLRGRLTQLVDNVDAVDPEFAGLMGTGRLNAFKALQENDGNGPDEITDLAAANVSITSITLTWTSPADSANGSASVYDIRYATFPITSANFNAATQVVNPPTPLPAETTQSYTASGLSPGTVYYFAIKSADFFGNYSDISNVLEQATNFPPIVSVSPDSLLVNLQTAEITTRTLTISNAGLGPLNFRFDSLASPTFATPTPDTGTVAALSNFDISVIVDANNLLPGTYHQNLILDSNDPETPSLTIPVTLNVTSNGEPIASVEPDTLDFGQVFETGSEEQSVTVHNAGAETLTITSVSSSNGEFTTDFTGSISVAPFENAIITVTYNPSGLVQSSGTLTITTNDPDNSSLTVHLQGEGVPAPDIEVIPSSLSASLNTGQTATRTLTVRNTGGSDLDFSIEVTSDDATAKVAAVKTITIQQSNYQRQNVLQKANARTKYTNQVKLKSVGQTAAIANVLILTPDDDVSDIESILDGFADVEADVFPVASLPSITLANLTNYDVVFTTNNGQWLGAGGVDPEVIGDLLADYIDAGGKVISNSFNYSFDAWKLEGRFIDEQYGPFIPSTSDQNTTVELGDILTPAHPIIQGVTELAFDGFVQNVGLAPGATAIAEWDNGDLFLAANENVVALNLLPSLGNGDPLQFIGDLPLIYQNAIHFLSGPGFIEVNPSQGTITAGAQLDLEVIFDATGLDSGVYAASINISTNVPNAELVTVPAVLTVLGPEFTVSPDSLAEELEKNQTSTRTLVLSNNGSQNQTFTVDVQGVDTGVTIARKSSGSGSEVSPVIDPSEKILRNSRQRATVDYGSKEAINVGRSALRNALPITSSETQYVTDFESFIVGNISGQQNWFGQFGNWRIETVNPSSGSKHFRGLSDGFGQSAAFTPAVPIGTEEKSTASMKLNIRGARVTWQIIPESPTAGLVNTRIQFDPNGVVSALITDGVNATFDAFATTPTGYFDLTIEVDRDSSYFHVYFDNTKVYSGQGFTGNIEEVVILSGMEVQGPTLDLDDLRIIDGTKDTEVTFLSVSPLSGNLPAGSSIELDVTFNSNDLEFGTYFANININIDETTLTVPASLRVFGDPNIDVDPTFLQAIVDYKEDTTKFLTITNTGGDPLDYSLQVIGASTGRGKLVATKSNQSKKIIDDKTRAKIARDERESRTMVNSVSAIQLLTGSPLLQEDFEDASFPPAGWQVIDNEGTGVVWKFAADYEEDNYTGGTGEAATASSDAAGEFEYDTELITPSISATGFKNISIQYNVNYQNLANLDFLDLDIQVDGGAWTNVIRWNEDHGTLRGTGVSVTQALGSYIGTGSSFRLRWHYYDPNSGDFDWYAQVDDVVVYGDPRAWLSVSPSSGTIPVGEAAIIAAKFDATDIGAGTYVGGIVVSSNAAEDPIVGVLAQLTVRSPAIISVTPTSLYQELLVDEQAKQTLTISNSGSSTLKFAFGNTPLPSRVSATRQQRIAPTVIRTTQSSESPDLMDIKAMRSGVSQSVSTQLYVTGFEDFAPGNMNGQKGWVGQFGNWSIESDNPHEGFQHITSVSDGLGATRAFSPTVALGIDPISSTSMFLDLEEGATWQVVPQSPTGGFVITRIAFDKQGALTAMVKDATGNAVFVPIVVSLPDGYFELRIDVERATSIFTLFINGAEVFSGQGFTGNIEQIVLFGLMEATGSTLFVDNLAIYDGPSVAPWLSFDPRSGIVPPGGSTEITIGFDATNLEAGIYSDTLKISSNDPVTSRVDVPVTLKVIVNTPPELAPIDTLEVIELSSVDITFTATDIDNEYVTVALKENLAFVTLLDTASGSATYRIRPLLGDRGEYDLEVIATDARGKQDTEIFHLSVVPYGVESLTLFNTRNNIPVATFTDTVEVDIAQPDFSRLNIRANTNPATVGSVKFWIDNRYINVDNTNPYDLGLFTLPLLAGGDHILVARSYTGRNGTGSEGKSIRAVIRIINSATVSDFDVVKINGSKIIDLVEGTVIDVTQSVYRRINIKANTTGSKVRSVVFTLNGVRYRIDNLAPYQLNGLGTLIDLPWTAVPGSYAITATPYSEWYGLGVPGESLTINFKVVNGVSNASARSRTQQASEDIAMQGSEEGAESIRVYPVPVQNELHVEIDEVNEGRVGFIIHNTQGQQIFGDDGSTRKFQNYTVNTSAMTPGVYFIHIRYPDGKQVVRKFFKE